MIEYSFVIDTNGKQLSPTKVSNAWYLIRKNRAKLISKYPMVIKLNKSVDYVNNSKFIIGIDDGSKNVGISIIQKCQTKNKVVFKGTIKHRQDVKKLMEQRSSYRKYKRQHKRYRPARFNNRASSKKIGRLAPSILQKRQAIIRVINRINQWVNISKYCLEDVAIDIRVLQEDKKLYKWQYKKSNRLDENIRKATIIRDDYKCLECSKTKCILEVHHIVPRRMNGSNTLSNLITLCRNCHQKIEGKEEKFINKYQKLINGKNIRFDYAQHVMQGKNHLRKELSKLGELEITTGGDTANKRIDWCIPKSHSNDAIAIIGLKPDNLNIKEWIIKPMRRQSKSKTDNVLGIKHRDLVSYTYKNGEEHIGYVTALYPKLNVLNFQSKTKHCKKVNARKCNLLWKYNKIYWLECV